MKRHVKSQFAKTAMDTTMSVRKVGLWVVMTLALVGLQPGGAGAELVTQLDFTGGSIGFKVGSTTLLNGNFTQNGTLVMGQYQPLPNVIPPITLAGQTLQIFTAGPNPFPSGSTSGGTISADLTSLFAGLSGSFFPGNPTQNIGGNATGTFNPFTNTFSDLSWTAALGGNKSLVFSLNGTAQVAAVPLPGALLLFGSGLAGLVGAARRRVARS